MSIVELDEVKFINFFTYKLFLIANKTVKVFIQDTIYWNLISWMQFSKWCASSLTDKYDFLNTMWIEPYSRCTFFLPSNILLPYIVFEMIKGSQLSLVSFILLIHLFCRIFTMTWLFAPLLKALFQQHKHIFLSLVLRKSFCCLRGFQMLYTSNVLIALIKG